MLHREEHRSRIRTVGNGEPVYEVKLKPTLYIVTPSSSGIWFPIDW